MSLRIAYLVNQYPKVSHSFIRREILALERRGLFVQRIAIRGCEEELVDEQDLHELNVTRHVLDAGLGRLVLAMASHLFTRPRRFFSAFALATRMSVHADRSLPYHWVYFAEACVVSTWMRASGAAHLHAHFGTNSAEVAMLASLLAGIPYSFTCHGPLEFDQPGFIGLAEKIRHASFVIAISSYCRSQMFRWIDHSHWSKVQVVHCALDSEYLRGDAFPPSTAARLVCVGRICEQKGQLLLVAAAKRVHERGIPFELVLAGDGEMRLVVEDLIRDLDLVEHVRITGWISGEQVRREILQARALVLPSFAEGLPVVIMEAMALCRPVLSTYVAGIPELVLQGECGWLFPAGDVELLADAMQECLGAPAQRLETMGLAAQKRVLTRHDVDVEAARLAALFESSVRNARNPA